MNQTIETINHWGARFQEFAWPMLWQSGLLILVVYALDWALARKLRASIRHALWLVVLVKLLLPPTLALPTGIAWWLVPAKHDAPLPKYTITYPQTATPIEANFPTIPLPKPPPPQLNRAGEILLGTVTISAALLAWLILRWIQVAALVRRATDAPALTDSLAAARRRISRRRRVRLKLVDDRLSPAVCGLFRPVILLPRLLAERLTENQLQAVLLHELIHLRRWDIWMNCAQALLQILYWWHPLVWIANGRMRRVREEAVDDAVMLALNDDAELYAPTLLEVAKLAFHRPSLSLGLVGIMESRNALRQRIERLMEFRAPRSAGLTLVSMFGILAFSAVALPMGSAPRAADDSIDSVANPVVAAMSPKANAKQVLITADLYEVSPADFQKYFANLGLEKSSPDDSLSWTYAPADFLLLRKNLKSAGVHSVFSPRIQTRSGVPARLDMSDGTNSFSFECTVPFVSNSTVQCEVMRAYVEPGGQAMETNRFGANLRWSNNGGAVLIPATWFRRGINLNPYVLVVGMKVLTDAAAATTASVAAINPNTGLPMAGSAGAMIDPQTGLPIAGGGAEPVDANTGLPIAADTNQLLTRVFKVDPETFPAAVQRAVKIAPSQISIEDPGTNVSSQLRAMCRLAGVDLTSPPGKAIFYNDDMGMVFVKATASDLEDITKIVETFNQSVPQIHIKSRFYQVPSGTMDGLTQFLNASTNTDSGLTGFLTPDNARAVVKALQAVKGAEVLAEPEVVTTTGRQTQMRSTQTITIITNSIYVQNPTNPNNGAVVIQTEKIETGPIFDVIPYLLADGYTISLQAVATDTEFYGYAQVPKHTQPRMATNTLGQTIPLPIIWPVFQLHENRALVNIYDDQSFLMVLDRAEIPTFGSTDKKRAATVAKHIADADKKNHTSGQIIVLVTATVIDAAGNRVHTDYMDFQRASIPSQSVPTMLPPQRWQKDYFDNPAGPNRSQQY